MQEMNVLILSLYEVTLGVFFAITTIVLATKFLNKFVLSLPIEGFIRKRHKSGCLISVVLVFSVTYLVRGSVQQSVLALQSLAMSHGGFSLKIFVIALVYFAIFFIITFLAAFIIIFIITKVYRWVMNDIDFDDEIEHQDNLALSIFLSGIVLSLLVFIDTPVQHFLGSLVFHQYLGGL